jgi:hypothetical protein
MKYSLAVMTAVVSVCAPPVTAVCSNISTTAATLRYQITSDRWDPVLHQHWISVTDCDHPERPILSRITNSASDLTPASKNDLKDSPTASGPLLVRAGENITVLRREDSLQIEIRGVAEQSATLGKQVRVRLSKVGVDIEQPQKEIVGVVSGPATVEMQP